MGDTQASGWVNAWFWGSFQLAQEGPLGCSDAHVLCVISDSTLAYLSLWVPMPLMAIAGRASRVEFKMFIDACLAQGFSSYQTPSSISTRDDAPASTVSEAVSAKELTS